MHWAIPLASDVLAYTGPWTRTSLPSFYGGFAYQTTTQGAWLNLTGVVAKRLALLATKCPTCGLLRFSWKGMNQSIVSLEAPTTRHRQSVDLWFSALTDTSTVMLEVISSGKPVIIEGLAISKS